MALSHLSRYHRATMIRRRALFLLLSWCLWHQAVPRVAAQDVVENDNNNNNNHATDTQSTCSSSAGVDVSWPMKDLKQFYQKACPDTQARYELFMQQCAEQHGGANAAARCERNEQERLEMNRNQPPSMTNFTTLGFAKVQIPPHVYNLLSEFWHAPQNHALLAKEDWRRGSIYTNHFNTPTDTLDIHRYMPKHELRQVELGVKQVLEGWSGVPLVPTSMYGIRVYGRDSILTPHCDRLPLVLSAILNIDQSTTPLVISEDKDKGEVGDTTTIDKTGDDSTSSVSSDVVEKDDNNKDDNYQDWPLEVIAHDGKAYNVTIQPGEMILYESHSIIHGRPYPLKGEYYANLFIHFEPVGYTFDLEERWAQEKEEADASDSQSTLSDLFQSLLKRQHKPVESGETTTASLSPPSTSPLLPPYQLTPEEESRWRQDYYFYRKTLPKGSNNLKKTPGATSAHSLAAAGNVSRLKEAVAKDPAVLDKKDGNGWKPIHEAARGGHTKVLEYMIEKGIDVNERTHDGKGASPLWWTLQYYPENHPAVQLLRRHGAVALAPRGQNA